MIAKFKYLFESIYFLLDNKFTIFNYSEIWYEMFQYDLGIYYFAWWISSGSHSTGFNFIWFYSLLIIVNLDKEYVLEDLTLELLDINRLFNDVMYPMREWLKNCFCK